MPVACRQFWGPDVQKLWFSTVAVLDKVADVPARAVHRPGVDVPVFMQRRRLALGGATDSVHRLVWWTSPVCTETGGSQQGVMAMKGVRSSSHR